MLMYVLHYLVKCDECQYVLTTVSERHIIVTLETSLSRQSIALVLTTKNNETKHHIHQKHKKETEKMPWLIKQAMPWFAMPFKTSSQEKEQALILQPRSLHGAITTMM